MSGISNRALPPDTVLKEQYVLQSVIGMGNFGITYAGWDKLLESRVAIKEFFPINRVSRNTETGERDVKVLQKEGYDKILQKYLNEGRLLSQLNRVDGIVSIREFFYENNTAYIVMDYIEGQSLKECVKEQGPMPEAELLHQIEPVLAALARVHEAGIIHRDISPDNLITTGENKLVLVDFGSARFLNAEEERTMTVLVKKGYSSPEAYGSRGEIGPWSDVYAICAVMYYMASGRAPEGAVDRLLKDRMVSLMDMPSLEMSPGVRQVIMKGLSVSRDERYRNMEELMEAFRQAAERKEKGGFRVRKTAAGMVGAVALTVLCVLFVWMFFFHRDAETKNVSGTPGADGTTASDGGGDSAAAPMAVNTPEAAEASPAADLPARTAAPKAVVPDVTGITYKKAEKKLKKNHLRYRVIWKKNREKKGIVIAQGIRSGKRVKYNTKIKITVSKGSEPAVPTAAPAASSGTSGTSGARRRDYDGIIG